MRKLFYDCSCFLNGIRSKFISESEKGQGVRNLRRERGKCEQLWRKLGVNRQEDEIWFPRVYWGPLEACDHQFKVMPLSMPCDFFLGMSAAQDFGTE